MKVKKDLIYQRAKALGMSKGELAKRAGTSRQNLWNLTTNRNLGWKTLERVAKVLGFSAKDLLE